MLQTIFIILFLLVISATINPKWFGIQAPRWKVFFGGWFILFIIGVIGGSLDEKHQAPSESTAEAAPAIIEQQPNTTEVTKPNSSKPEHATAKSENQDPKVNEKNGNNQNKDPNWGIVSSRQCLANYCTQEISRYSGPPESSEEKAERKQIIAECVENMRQLILLGSEKDNCG